MAVWSPCETTTCWIRVPSRRAWERTLEQEGRVEYHCLQRALFRRPPKHGEATCSVVSTHLCNVVAKRRDIARHLLESQDLMCEEGTDLRGGDLYEAAALGALAAPEELPWHRSSPRHRSPMVLRAQLRAGGSRPKRAKGRTTLSTSTWCRLTRLTHTWFEAKRPRASERPRAHEAQTRSKSAVRRRTCLRVGGTSGEPATQRQGGTCGQGEPPLHNGSACGQGKPIVAQRHSFFFSLSAAFLSQRVSQRNFA